jgi:hypothetical protein
MQENSLEIAKLFLVSHARPGHIYEHKHKLSESKFLKKIQNLEVPVFGKIIPVPKTISLDLGELNSFIQDASIKMIQCDGPGILLNINQNNEVIQTQVSLTEDEIHEIIQKFSSRSGQPMQEPVFQAQVGNLKLMAITSKYSNPRFIITKVG